jgi:hypothetical protein
MCYPRFFSDDDFKMLFTSAMFTTGKNFEKRK